MCFLGYNFVLRIFVVMMFEGFCVVMGESVDCIGCRFLGRVEEESGKFYGIGLFREGFLEEGFRELSGFRFGIWGMEIF